MPYNRQWTPRCRNGSQHVYRFDGKQNSQTRKTLIYWTNRCRPKTCPMAGSIFIFLYRLERYLLNFFWNTLFLYQVKRLCSQLFKVIFTYFPTKSLVQLKWILSRNVWEASFHPRYGADYSGCRAYKTAPNSDRHGSSSSFFCVTVHIEGDLCWGVPGNVHDGKHGSGSWQPKVSERVDMFPVLQASGNLVVRNRFHFIACTTDVHRTRIRKCQQNISLYTERFCAQRTS